MRAVCTFEEFGRLVRECFGVETTLSANPNLREERYGEYVRVLITALAPAVRVILEGVRERGVRVHATVWAYYADVSLERERYHAWGVSLHPGRHDPIPTMDVMEVFIVMQEGTWSVSLEVIINPMMLGGTSLDFEGVNRLLKSCIGKLELYAKERFWTWTAEFRSLGEIVRSMAPRVFLRGNRIGLW